MAKASSKKVMGVSNADRAEWALQAIEAFEASTRSDREDSLADLLGDLLHWCDQEGIDFEHELNRGRSYYQEELNESEEEE